MNKLNNLEIEFQELSDNELETVVGGTLKSSKRTSYYQSTTKNIP